MSATVSSFMGIYFWCEHKAIVDIGLHMRKRTRSFLRYTYYEKSKYCEFVLACMCYKEIRVSVKNKVTFP